MTHNNHNEYVPRTPEEAEHYRAQLKDFQRWLREDFGPKVHNTFLIIDGGGAPVVLHTRNTNQ